MTFEEFPKWIAKRDSNFYSSLFLVIFSGAVASEAYRLGLGQLRSPGPGFMIFGTSIILGLLAIHLFVKSLLIREYKEEKSVWKGKRLGQPASFFLALLIYDFVLVPVGYLLSTFFLCVFLFSVTGERKWSKGEWAWILGGAALTSFLTYLVFSRWFMLMLPTGLIEFF
jgi:hypothetical protein